MKLLIPWTTLIKNILARVMKTLLCYVLVTQTGGFDTIFYTRVSRL